MNKIEIWLPAAIGVVGMLFLLSATDDVRIAIGAFTLAFYARFKM